MHAPLYGFINPLNTHLTFNWRMCHILFLATIQQRASKSFVLELLTKICPYHRRPKFFLGQKRMSRGENETRPLVLLSFDERKPRLHILVNTTVVFSQCDPSLLKCLEFLLN